MMRRIHRIVLLFVLLLGCAGMSYVQAAKVTLTVQASPSSYGQVRIGTNAWSSSTQLQTATGAKPTISAQANSGYRFTKWNDNNTNASRQITIGNSNVTYTAYFEPNTVTLTVTSNNTNYGTVTGGGTYNYGTSVTIKATPKTGYHFVQWSDGNTTASRSITATANASYQATFAVNQYTIKFVNNGTTLQTLTVNHGVKPSYTGSTPTKTATAQYTYTFSGWSPTIVAATADATYTAQFSSTVRSYTIRFLNGSSVLQSSSVKYGTTPSYTGTTPTKSATVQYIYTFSGWSPTIYAVNKAQDYTAQFSSTVRSYKITGASANTAMGTVSGTATKQYGQTVTLTATPESCADFVQWNDGNTDNPRTVTVTGTKTYTATFAAKTYNGTCGTNLQWSLNRCTGVLSITGSGAMTNYPQPTGWVSGGNWHAPWWSYRSIITSVTIANTVTSIGINAFDECENITSVSMGSGIKTIGLGAFFECSSLTSITIPNGVTTINAQTFEYCSSLTSVTIPNSVTSIESSAFNGCTSLSSITIPNSITTIGTYAFKGCSSLTSITIPSSVTAIGGEAFLASSQKLKDIYVSWTSADAIPAWSNMTYGTRANITLHVPCGYGDIYRATKYWQDYTMQGSGTSNYTLTVKTNNSSFGTVQIDGETAGTNVSKSVHCEDTHTIRATRNTSTCCVFKQWSDGNRDNPRRIGIDENTTFTAEFVEGLTSGKCGPDAWYVLSCDSVMTISGTGAINASAFNNTTLGKSIKSVVIEEGITDIGGSNGHVFYMCYSLKSIYIPASVTNIGQYPLLRCNDLEIIQVDPANTVYDSRSNCNAIIETATNKMIAGCMHTVMPHTTEIIDRFCFEYLHKLKSMLIASSVHAFSGYTFKECENLKDIYVEWTEDIPVWNSVTYWSEHSSDNLDPGITLHVPCGKKAMYEAEEGWNKYNIVDDHLKGGMCGVYGSNLTWMLSCDSVLTIRGSGAMENFVYSGGTSTAEWFDYRETVKTVILTDEITSIGENAFAGFINLTDIYAPWTENIPVLPASNNPQSSVTLHIPCSAISAYQAAGWGNYTIQAEYTASGTCGADGDNLTWTLCDDGTLTISGTGEMADYTNTNRPSWNSSNRVRTVIIEEGVTSIGSWGFPGCTELEHVEIPSSVTTIGQYAFIWSTNKLESITIPEGVVTIGKRAFESCYKLQNITLPSTLETLGDYVFISCSSLREITIPNSVSTIGNGALRASSLTDIYVSWESADAIPTWQNLTNRSPQSDITLHVPCGTEELYNAADGWNGYTIVNEMLASGTCGADGDNLTWALCDSTLYISGTGAMAHFPMGEAPWYPYRKFITSVTIASGVTSIGNYSFNGCSNLTTVTIPPSLTSVGQNAFTSCWAMESVYISDLEAWSNIDFGKYDSSPFSRNGYSNYVGGGDLYVNDTKVTTLTIPDGITEIKNAAFYGCACITDIQFNQVTSIGREAFNGCHGLTEITIPEGVTAIGQYGFTYCSHLQSISIPASASSLGTSMLVANQALTDIHVHWTENIPVWPNQFTSKSPQSDITLHVPCGTEELYNAADGWKDYTIEADIPNVKSGTYGPDNIEWTFDYCDSLLTITGNGELQCDQNTWGPNAGGINPNAVKSVFIGKGVTYLGIYTLSYMTNIEYIEIEEGHPTHRTGCNAIIRIGSELEGDTLIFGCPHTVIPTTCSTIRGYAFWDNHHVTEMTIPSSVKQIANMQGSLWQGNNGQVFYTSNSASEGLKDLYVEWTKLEDIPAVPNNRLGDMTKVRLHVPCGTTSLYKQVTGWSNFKEYIEESATFTITVQAADPTMGDVSITVNP